MAKMTVQFMEHCRLLTIMQQVINLTKMNVTNVAMGTAVMDVGQYYMTQINDQLEDITSGIEKITDLQEKEFKNKSYALVAEVQKSSTCA